MAGLLALAVCALWPAAALGQDGVPSTSARPVPKLDPGEWLIVGNLIAAPLILFGLWAANIIRPASLAAGRGVQGHPAWVWLFGALVVWGSVQAGAGLAMGIVGGGGSVRQQALVSLGAFGMGTLAAFAMVRLLSGGGGGGAGLSIKRTDVLTGVLGLLLTYPILDVTTRGSVWAAEKIAGSKPDLIAHATLKTLIEERGNPWAWGLILAAVVGAPLVEEVIYRGMLQSALLRLTKHAWASVLLASAAFALIHRVGGAVPWHAIPTLFVLGLAMGIAFERTKSLGVPIVMHMLFNAANVAVALWAR